MENVTWKSWWRNLAVMPSRRYNSLGGKVGRHFVWALSTELQVVWAQKWNVDNLIVFKTVIIQHTYHTSGAQAIRLYIGKCLDAWEAGQHKIMVEDTDHTCKQYLYTSHCKSSEEPRCRPSTAW